MAKKLKANDISNLHKQEFSWKVINVKSVDGTEFEVLIQEKLNETSIENLLLEYIERSNYCAKNNLKFDEIYNIYYLLFKYFTNIEFGKYKSIKKQYEEDLYMIKKLKDLGLFEQILNHFNAESMTKIQESLTTYAKQLKIVSNNKLKEVLEDELEAEREIKNEKKL